MSEQQVEAGGAERPGLFRPVRSALAAASAAFHTRLELLVLELEEEKERLKQTVMLTLLLCFGLSLGLILLTIFAVALFWEQGWIFALGVLAALYLGIGVAAAVKLRSDFLLRPRLFAATLGELAKDRDRLRDPTRE